MITGKTQLLSVIGNPIKHSMSPEIHNFLAEYYKIDMVYNAFEVTDLEGSISAMRTLGIRGYNVTAPYKYEVGKFLDDIDDGARFSHSVNTVVNRNGRLFGYSTDGIGLYRGFLKNGIKLQNKDILIIGAGGVTRPVCVMLYNNKVKSVTIKNRTISRAEQLTKDLNSDLHCNIFNNSDLEKYDIIINTTSVGMGSTACPIDDFRIFKQAEYVVDLIYYPRETTFLKNARLMGIPAMNGISMLIGQALEAFELFSDVTVDNKLFDELEALLFE